MPQGISEIESLASFTSDPERFPERLRRRGEPVLLTQQGEAGVVVQDAASYQRFLERVDRLETIAAVKESLQDVAARRTRPMREALAELEAKHWLPPVQDELSPMSRIVHACAMRRGTPAPGTSCLLSESVLSAGDPAGRATTTPNRSLPVASSCGTSTYAELG